MLAAGGGITPEGIWSVWSVCVLVSLALVLIIIIIIIIIFQIQLQSNRRTIIYILFQGACVHWCLCDPHDRP